LTDNKLLQTEFTDRNKSERPMFGLSCWFQKQRIKRYRMMQRCLGFQFNLPGLFALMNAAWLMRIIQPLNALLLSGNLRRQKR